MSNNPRVVLDTNVLVSAALTEQGKPRQALTYVTSSGILLMSEAAFDELTRTLLKPKLQKFIDVQDRLRYLDWIAAKQAILRTFLPVSVKVF